MPPRPTKPRSIPPANDWRTSDQEEIERRRMRAREGRFKVSNQSPEHPVHGTFLVRTAKDREYQVEIRDARSGHAVCGCIDFGINGLGTCKHVEAVWLHLKRREGRLLKVARERGTDRFEVVPDRQVGELRLIRPEGVPVPAGVARLFGPDGRLRPGLDPESAVRTLRDAEPRRRLDVRVSSEVDAWLESRRRAADRVRLRHEYELKVQSGEWPPQETRVALFPYQREGMLHLAFTERAMLADEMGLGKTIQAIAACALLRRLGRARRVLVVTPASLKTEWEEQIQRFTGLASHVVYGGRHHRLAFYRSLGKPAGAGEEPRPEPGGPFFILMNYEQVVPDLADIQAHLRPDVVVLDEAQRIKNWNTRTSMTLKRLRSRYAFVLSGTPLENRIDELRSLVDFLDPSVFGPLFRFNREFYELDERGRPTGCCNLIRLHERIRPLFLRRRKADVETELPPRRDANLFVPLSDAQRSHYALHEQEVMKLASIAERRPLSPREQDRLQIELAMMRMVCDTPYILDREDRTCPKLAEVERLIGEAGENDAKVIVFSEWERMLELVRDRCRERGIGHAWHTGSVPQKLRRAQILAFKSDPGCRVFLTTDAGATGLNLQAASIVVNCDLPWNPARLEQRIARAWRKHQPRSVMVFNLISENTIEHRMLRTLATKRAVAESVLDRPGSVDRVELRPGRKAVLDRVRQLVGESADPHAGQPGEAPRRPTEAEGREAFRLDPVAAFVRELAERLGPNLVACDERLPSSGGAPWLCLVVRQDVEDVRSRLENWRESFLRRVEVDSGTGGAGAGLPRCEVLDPATAALLARFAEAGLVAAATPRRQLWPADPTPPPPPPLRPEEREKLAEFLRRARHTLRRARVLGAAEFADECRSSLAEAALHAACASAVVARVPPPETLEGIPKDQATRCWGGEQEAITAFLSRGAGDWVSVADALDRILDRAASAQGS